MIQFFKATLSILIIIVLALELNADPLYFNYNGRILRPDDTPLDANSVDFTVQIVSTTNSCVLYEETHNLDMTNAAGVFNLKIGSGARSTDGNYEDTSNIDQVFDNTLGNITSLTCDSGTDYDANPGDARAIRLFINEGTGVIQFSEVINMASVPYARYATKLEGMGAQDFLAVDGANNIDQSNLQNVFGGGNYGELMNLINGTSTQYADPSGSNFTPTATVDFNNQVLENLATPVNPNDAANKTYSDSYIGGAAADSASLSTLAGGADIGKVLSWNGTQWQAATPSTTDATKLPLAGGTMTGDIDMGGNDILNSGFITMTANTYLHLGTYAADPAGLAAGHEGVTWYNTTSDELKIWDGTAAQVIGGFGIGTAAGDAMGADAVPNCNANEKLQMSAGPVYAWSCVTDQTGGDIANGGNNGAITIGSNNNTLSLEANNSVAMTIATNGFVGIGRTTAPSLGGSSSRFGVKEDRNGGSLISIENADGGNSAGSGIHFGTDSLNHYMTAYGSGNTGTGTYGPNTLAIQSSGRLTHKAQNEIQFYTSGTTTAHHRMTIDSSGSVGIGLDNDLVMNISTGAKLDVEGRIVSGPTGTASGQTGEIRFEELAVSGIDYVGFRAPDAVGTSQIWTLPAADGASGSVLSTNGSGVLSWQPAGTGDFESDGSVAMEGRITLADGIPATPSIGFTSDTDLGIYYGGTNTIGFTEGGTPFASLGPANGLVINGGPMVRNDGYRFQADTNTGITNPAADTIGLVTAGNQVLTIDPSFQVGINNNSPSANLDVTGDFRVVSSGGSTSSTLESNSNTPADEPRYRFNRSRGSTLTPLQVADGDSLGGIEFGAYAPSSSYQKSVEIKTSVNGTPSGVNVPGDISFGINNGSGMEYPVYMTADNLTVTGGKDLVLADADNSAWSGFRAPATVTGSVLYTLPPADGSSGQVLSTNGSGVLSWTSGSGSGDFESDGSVAMTGDLNLGNNGIRNLELGSNAAPSISFNGDATTGVYSSGANTINFATGGINGGSIGLNDMTIFKPIRADNGDATTPDFSFNGDIDTGIFDPAANTIGFSTAGSEKMRITSSGNVGIGTTAPGHMLELSGGDLKVIDGQLRAERNSGAVVAVAEFKNRNTGTSTQGARVDFVTGNIDKAYVIGGVDGAADAGYLSFETRQSGTMTEVMRMDSSGNVGLGTTTPNSNLQIVSTAGPVLTLSHSSGNTNKIRMTNGSGTYELLLLDTSSAGASVSSHGKLDLFAHSSQPIEIGSSGSPRVTIASGGNVGIGTNAPSEKLDVEGSILSGPKGTGAGEGGAILFEELVANIGAGGVEYVGFRAPDSIADGDEVIWELPSADGTSGQVLQTNGSGVLSWVTNGAGSGDFMADGSVPMTGQLDASNGTAAAPGISFSSAQDVGLFQLGGELGFSVGGLERARFDSQGSLSISTKLGIGTSLATDSLDVEGGIAYLPAPNTAPGDAGFANSQWSLWLDEGSDEFELKAKKSNGTVITQTVGGDDDLGNHTALQDLDLDGNDIIDVSLGSVSAPSISFTSGDTNTGIWSPAGDTIAVSTAGNEALRIDASGNVGIGTSAPAQLLHLESSDPRLQFVDTDTGADSYISASSSNGSLFIRADDNNESANSEIAFDVDGITRMRLDSLGFMGIGDSSADAHLEVSASGGGGGVALMVSSNDNTDGDLFIVEENGKVGVGTTAPGSKFHLRDGNLLLERDVADNAASAIDFQRDRAGGIVIDNQLLGEIKFQGLDGGTIMRPAALIQARVDGVPGVTDMPGRLEFYTSLDGTVAPAERMRIDNTGNVGIGTTTPSSDAKLSISDGHIETSQTTAPTAAAKAAAGTGASCSVTRATDTAMEVTLTTGTTGWSTGSYCRITFNQAYANQPIIVFSAANALAGQAMGSRQVYTTGTTTHFDINLGNAAVSQVTTVFNVMIMGYKSGGS